MNDDLMLTLTGAAGQLGISEPELDKLIAQGSIQATDYFGRPHVAVSELDRFNEASKAHD